MLWLMEYVELSTGCAMCGESGVVGLLCIIRV